MSRQTVGPVRAGVRSRARRQDLGGRGGGEAHAPLLRRGLPEVDDRPRTLTVHVVLSVGWLGSVAAFLALSIAGLTSADAQVMRSAYISMDLIGRYVIVPLSLASTASGIFQALASPWGLFRHYWVAVKFVLTVLSTLLLLLH